MTLSEYYELLCAHDWYYEFSDDHSVWRRGHRERTKINAIYNQSDKHEKLCDSFINWLSDRGPEPEAPKEE